ncbi:MAG: hypothetical protein ACI9DF_004117 [Verrucomicrobiales bacterium]|jgi:hypothetical protein
MARTIDPDIAALDWLVPEQAASLQHIRDDARDIERLTAEEKKARRLDTLMVILAAVFLAGQIAGVVL